MSVSAADNPEASPGDILQQLKRILASSTFVTRVKPSQVFLILVEKSIEGLTLSEEDIRSEVFPDPPYDREATHVRTALNTVRKLLESYYKGPGLQDPVIIRLPKKFSNEAKRTHKGQSY